MNLCLNAFVIQFPDGLLDTCSVTAPRALFLPFAHRGHCKDEDSYKECSSHVEFSISLTRPKINYRETCATSPRGSGWMANTQSTHIALPRGSLHRLVRRWPQQLRLEERARAFAVPSKKIGAQCRHDASAPRGYS